VLACPPDKLRASVLSSLGAGLEEIEQGAVLEQQLLGAEGQGALGA
jgi:hypothetical protein